MRESSRNLYNVGVYDFILLATKTRRKKWTLHVTRMGKKRRTEPLERPMRRRGDNIKMDIRMGSVGCINMALIGIHGRHWS